MKIRFAFVLYLASLSTGFGQILFSESFNVLLDSTRNIKGSITPEFKLQTQRKTLIEFTNMADVSLRIRKNSLTFANKVEFNKFGSETFLSGGYVYAKFKNNLDKHISIEYFAQIHWAEARGLQNRYSAGPTLRWKIVKKSEIGLFLGSGPMYEFEEWNYNGVDESKIPIDNTSVINEYIKSSSYISFKQWLSEKIFVDLSVYHQAPYDNLSLYRVASSSRLAYQLTENLQLVFVYQNIYDDSPVVPIDNWFHRIISTIAISF